MLYEWIANTSNRIAASSQIEVQVVTRIDFVVCVFPRHFTSLVHLVVQFMYIIL